MEYEHKRVIDADGRYHDTWILRIPYDKLPDEMQEDICQGTIEYMEFELTDDGIELSTYQIHG